MPFAELVAGLALLIFGGDLLVRGAVSIAVRLGVSPLLIGLTVVGFGTSTPELLTSLQAAFAGSPGIAVGNVVGSNIANILLILGGTAALVPVAVRRTAFRRDGAVLTFSAVVCAAIVLTGSLERWAGLVLVALLIGYLVRAASAERVAGNVAQAPLTVESRSAVVPAVMVLGGFGLTMLGARFLVSGASAIAALAGLSEAVIGLTVVAIGTSLPELVSSIIAALRREPELAFGNIVGSNIFNTLGILGVTAVAHPIPVPAEIAEFDIWVMLAATVALIAAVVTAWRITRAEGTAMLAAYAAYLGLLVAR